MDIADYKKELESRRDFSVRFEGEDYKVRFIPFPSGETCMAFGVQGKEWVFLSLEKGWIGKLSLQTYRDWTIQEILEKGERL